MKIFAFYLPQFHEIEENNKWWGHGFTEWTNVKQAKPLYKGHQQPKHPLNDNYYDLMNKETVITQTTMMKQYGLTGFIYYHYYFKGRLILEKPAENLLKWTDIDQPFFFCWANHDWNRSWDGKKEILIKQEYGDNDDWEAHFQYLLPFFMDKRYEKKDNMPVFMLFKTEFSEKEKMFEYFNSRCIEYGFNGIYLIETYEGKRHNRSIENDFEQYLRSRTDITKAVHTREPVTSTLAYNYYLSTDLFNKLKRKLFSTFFHLLGKNYVYKLDGNKIYKYMICKSAQLDAIHGLFFEWDNTPRHKGRGYVITPPTKELFMQYMDCIKDNEYLFINAWNEWAEGMMLEPTSECGYRYLEWIKEWVDHDVYRRN